MAVPQRLEDIPADERANYTAFFEKKCERRKPVNAHHEAGHAVIAVALKAPLLGVDIIPRPYTHGGRFSAEMDSMAATHYIPDRPRNPRDMVLIAFAGPLAEHRFRGLKGPCRIPKEGSDWGAITMFSTISGEVLTGSPELVEAMNAVRPNDDPGSFQKLFHRARERYVSTLKTEAKSLVDRRWDAIEAVAAALVEKRELTARQVKAIAAKHPDVR